MFPYKQNTIYYFYENRTKIPLYIFISTSGELIISQDKIENFVDIMEKFNIFGISKFPINLKITYDDEVLIHIINNINYMQKTIDLKTVLDKEYFYTTKSNIYYVNLFAQYNFEFYQKQSEDKKKIIRNNKKFLITFVFLALNNNIICQKNNEEYSMTNISTEHLKQLLILLKLFNVTDFERKHNQIIYYNNKRDILKLELNDNIPIKFQFVYQKNIE